MNPYQYGYLIEQGSTYYDARYWIADRYSMVDMKVIKSNEKNMLHR